MCHPAWGPGRAPVPFPRELVRVRRLRDLVDREAHDGGASPSAEVAALVSRTGVTAEGLAVEFALAYGISLPGYIASRGLLTAGRRAAPSHP